MLAIAGRLIGKGYPTYITFEAGPTHYGIDNAKKLVEKAALAGADAVKFQIVDPDRLVPDKKQLFSYEVLIDRETGAREKIVEPLYDILKRRCMSREEWIEVKKYCDEQGITFFSTATFWDEVDFLAELGVDTIKICSGDVDFFQLIRKCARMGMCIQLDTGNATLGEVERAVDNALEEGCERILIHHCPSGYPARLESINLRIIPTLERLFGFPVAFSDHSPGWEMDIAAVALGANMIEKTITLDRTTRSVEHLFSLEPEEMRAFVQAVRDLEKALGSTRKIMSREERENSLAVRRSIVLAREVEAGEEVTEEVLDYARPGSGLRPEMAALLKGRTFACHLGKGHILGLSDIK